MTGTPMFMAPEVIQQKPYTQAVLALVLLFSLVFILFRRPIFLGYMTDNLNRGLLWQLVGIYVVGWCVVSWYPPLRDAWRRPTVLAFQEPDDGLWMQSPCSTCSCSNVALWLHNALSTVPMDSTSRATTTDDMLCCRPWCGSRTWRPHGCPIPSGTTLRLTTSSKIVCRRDLMRECRLCG